MVQKRLAALCEGSLRHTQYGFRAQRGTKHPLFILRRTMEWSTMRNKNTHLLFLDWKQAFDSIDHSALITALRRFGTPPNLLKLIATLYDYPSFSVKGFQDRLAQGEVNAGIRQGCPLSPYLFIIVLSVIFSDVDTQLLKNGVATNTWSVGRPTYDIEYADDTLMLSLTTPQMQHFLTFLETEASHYGMSLNNTKTELLTPPFYKPQSIHFLDGTKVPQVDTVKYLGSMISWAKPFETAFYHRAGVAEETFKKLRLVWNSSLPRRHKVRIFQSTFVPCLTYGLEALSLTTPHLKRIDAFYYRFLRRAINIKASYYSHIPNSDVYAQAGHPRKPSDYLKASQLKMLKEVYSLPQDSPIHNVVFCSAYRDRILTQGRRRGMQIPYWLESTTKRHYPELWTNHNAASSPNFKYVVLARKLRLAEKGAAPKRTH